MFQTVPLSNCPKHVKFYSKSKFEKLAHLFGFIIRIYRDARSPERQIACSVIMMPESNGKENELSQAGIRHRCPSYWVEGLQVLIRIRNNGNTAKI